MSQRERRARIMRLVLALREQRYPNASTLARAWRQEAGQDAEHYAVTSQTIKRDIAYLRQHLHAPLAYDQGRQGYYLTDPLWILPATELADDAQFAALFGQTVGSTLMPEPLRGELEAALQVQYAAVAPGEHSAEALRAVVCSTSGCAPVPAAIFSAVLEGWRACRQVRIGYRRGHDGVASEREIEIHGLFMAGNAWYARAYCHRRRQVLSLALHRITAAELQDTTFARSATVVAELRRGQVFDYEPVRQVCLRCTPAKAQLLAEREWFPGQQVRPQADGGLELLIPETNSETLLPWVVSFLGHVTIVSPPALRHAVAVAAQRLRAGHE